MVLPYLSILSGLGSFFGEGASQDQTTDSSFDSNTQGTSTIDRTELSPEMIKALTGLFSGGKLADAFKTSTSALTGQLGTVQKAAATPFDVSAFVKGISKQASNTINRTTDQGVNNAESNIGSSQGNNTMATLLASKLATDAASQKAGIVSQATAQGTQIRDAEAQSQTEQTLGLTGALNSSFASFLNILKGAQTSQTQTTDETTTGTSTSETSSPFNFESALSGLGSWLTNLQKTT